MSEPTAELIRQLLNRRELAALRLRAVTARRLGLGETEMLAVAYLAQYGELTPARLATYLDLSSGGVSALVRRMERDGHVERVPHPHDGRSSLVRLSDELAERAARAYEPLVRELDRLAAELGPADRAAVARFLAGALDAGERHAERTQRELRPRAGAPAPRRLPALWG